MTKANIYAVEDTELPPVSVGNPLAASAEEVQQAVDEMITPAEVRRS